MLYRKFGARSAQRSLPAKVRNRQRAAVLKRQQQRVTLQSATDLDEDHWRAFAEEDAVREEGCCVAHEEEDCSGITEPELPGLVAVKAAPGACVLLIPPTQKLTFTGKCHMTCLYGSVQVFGFAVHDGQPSYRLYSAHTHNALTIEAQPHRKSEKSKKETRKEARAMLREYLPLAGRRTLMEHFTPLCSVVLLESLEDNLTNFILGHPEYAKIFTPKLNEKSCCFSPEESALTCAGIGKLNAECACVMSESFTVATEELIKACIEDDSCPIILVSGPRNVGKSTFNRHLINQLLNRIPCVEYLECDVGQTEFTPPGCVSLLNITEPLLGSPFTHQREPRRMVYYGEASCENDLERYIEAVKHVSTSYKREAPLIINTMGWVRGFGLMLLIDIIRLLSPSHIIQISVKDNEDMPQLTPQYVLGSCGLHTKGKAPIKHKGLRIGSEEEEAMEEEVIVHSMLPTEHKLLCVSSEFSAAGDSNNMRCHSNILRDLSVLGYLGKLQPQELERPLPLNALVPYQVTFNAVAVRIINSDVAASHTLYSVNASWVGLCSLPDDVRFQSDVPVFLSQTPVCDCFGFGIVRGIDLEKKVYYILTPVPPQRLRLVNCLLIGSITVPHSIFKNQPGVKDDVPYVTTEYNFEILGAGKIKLNKQLKRREHQRSSAR
ncbi:polynucleotide 5'-hydroxyl-kinase NOL9 [Ambystoma mexicanum]|uniref:polynucleotide 5'-hydroxyl-kinase NOL9 n=1 Tax=Ambystoma mexicanum TaxID=8296 RepID=UPI0037E8FA7B